MLTPDLAAVSHRFDRVTTLLATGGFVTFPPIFSLKVEAVFSPLKQRPPTMDTEKSEEEAREPEEEPREPENEPGKPDEEPRKKNWQRYVAIGLLATAILVGLKLLIEHTTWGKENELWVFGKLQSSLSSIDLNNPVVVLDIASLPGGKRGEPTPRKDLQTIIQALAELEPKPIAIAVDVNFSPRGIHYAAPDDDKFFDFCLSITQNKKLPVFLAVGETKTAPPEAWLGSPLYKQMAVAAVADKYDTSHIPLWLESSASSEKLKTLNYALARQYRKQLPGAHPWIEWALETHNEEFDPALQRRIDEHTSVEYQDRLVNYSKLDQMKVAAAPDTSAESIKRAGAKYSGKLVILGDLFSADRVPVPGRVLDEPGSLVLASATYTLIKEPLFEFKWWVRVALDFLIAGLIIFAVAMIRRRSPDTSWISKQAVFVYVAVLVVLIGGWQLVTWAGILWLDFLLVALALLLHPKTEHFVDHLLEKLRKHPAPVVKTACVMLSVMAMSGELSAQEGLFLPAPCTENVAAVGLQLTKPKPTRKRKTVGTCYLGSKREGPWNELTEDNVKRQYHSGEYLKCDAQCTVMLYFCGTRRQEPISNPPEIYPIIHVYSGPPVWRDTRPDNLSRQARVFSPADPRLTNEPARPNARFRRAPASSPGSMSGITGRSASANRKPSPTENKVVNTSGANDKVQAVGAAVGDPLLVGARPVAPLSVQFLEALNKGNTARQKKDYAAAREHYLNAQKLRPDDQRGFQGLGNVFADEKNWSAAEQAYRDAIKRAQLSSELHLSLAFVLMQPMMANRDYANIAEVEDLLRTATMFPPIDDRVYDLYQQLVDVQARDLKQAEDFFSRAVVYAPESAKANVRFAKVLYLRGKQEEALAFVQNAEKHAVGEQLLEVANLYQGLGRYEDAERVWRTALKTMPNNPTVLYNLGSVMLQRKRFRSAEITLHKAVQLDPQAFAPELAYGIVRFRKGDLAGAESSLDQASRKVGDNADGLQRLAYWFSALGDAYSAKGKVADAVGAYEKSITHAENPEVRDRLLKAKQKRDAVEKRNADSP